MTTSRNVNRHHFFAPTNQHKRMIMARRQCRCHLFHNPKKIKKEEDGNGTFVIFFATTGPQHHVDKQQCFSLSFSLQQQDYNIMLTSSSISHCHFFALGKQHKRMIVT
jgi:hypothetical protein